MSAFKIFIVEDDTWYADILEYHLLLNPEYIVEKFTSGKDCLANMYKNPSVITIDYGLPDMKGKELLKRLKDSYPDLPVVVISGQEDITTAVELLKDGAYDYIVKDDETKDRLWNTMRNLKDSFKLKQEFVQLKEEVGKKYEFSKAIKGESPALKGVFGLMEKASGSNITVSISGETGTGKEMVAKAIHYNSSRKSQPFVSINVAAIPHELIESELFGHEKGAFTGAIARRVGKFEEAHKGTIFLDEIAEMDLGLQSKLLRVLQEREVTLIGSNKPIPVDVRVVTATHKNLAEEVKAGRFRQDLYYRLLGLPIDLPPLRARDHDILILAKFFADEFCKENKLPRVTFSGEARKKLLKHPYPGNVRELKAIVELSVIMSGKETIDEDDISFSSLEPEMDLFAEESSLEDYTVKIVRYFLEKYDNNAILVASKLKVGKSTIYRMIKKYNL